MVSGIIMGYALVSFRARPTREVNDVNILRSNLPVKVFCLNVVPTE